MVFAGLCYLNNKLELFKPLLKKHLLHFLLFMWFSLTVILFSAANILYFLLLVLQWYLKVSLFYTL